VNGRTSSKPSSLDKASRLRALARFASGSVISSRSFAAVQWHVRLIGGRSVSSRKRSNFGKRPLIAYTIGCSMSGSARDGGEPAWRHDQPRMSVTHPFEHWPVSGRRPKVLALISAALVLFMVIVLLDSPLRASDEGGTVSLEVAGSSGRASEITAAWRADGTLENAAFIDGLDFLYALVYSAALAGLCVAGSSAFKRRGHDRLALAGIVAAWIASAVAAFDCAENSALAVVLLDGPESPWPAIALGSAIPKFAGSVVALLFALAGGAVSTRRATSAQN
jgi:hypothetical protein